MAAAGQACLRAGFIWCTSTLLWRTLHALYHTALSAGMAKGHWNAAWLCAEAPFLAAPCRSAAVHVQGRPSLPGTQPRFVLERPFGQRAPQVVGVENPATVFKENKPLRMHGTPFERR